MAEVFLSYKREDKERVRLVAEALGREGFDVWWDERIVPAERWDEEIEQNIGAARAVIVFWTPDSVRSHWVRTEAEFAKSANKLVPITLIACQPPLAFLLVQAVDLTRWRGEVDDRNWLRAVAWLRDLIAGKPPTEQKQAQQLRADWRVAYGEFNGEPVFDGKTITRSAPAATLFRDRAELPLMRVIPGGQFKMGSLDSEGQTSERPLHVVSVAGPIAVGVFPLTRAEWNAVGPRYTPKDDGFGRDDMPVLNVYYADAQGWLEVMNSETGEDYRLLSEAEWEYCCRAGSDGAYNFSGEPTDKLACFRAPRPAPVGSLPPNAFGLYDMHGNVREWTGDLWHDSYAGAPTDAIAWTAGHSAMRVVRGGSWTDGPAMLRSASRGRAIATERCNFIGLRVAREIH